MKHTKTPWYVSALGGDTQIFIFADEGNREIAKCVNEEYAKYISTCVNNIDRITKERDDLLEAAKYMIEKLENGSLSERNDALLDLEQAIQNAEASDD
jgi:hypothetical protein